MRFRTHHQFASQRQKRSYVTCRAGSSRPTAPSLPRSQDRTPFAMWSSGDEKSAIDDDEYAANITKRPCLQVTTLFI
jgi:hypothetical protein